MWPRKIPQCRLPLSLVKPTISNQLVTVQAEAPLHPDYVCWYNSCEELTDWTIDPEITASINDTLFQEDKGSLDLVYPSDAYHYARLTPVSNCGKHWGFWIRCENSVPLTCEPFIFGTLAPTTYYIQFYIYGGKWAFRVNRPGGPASSVSDVTIEADRWYWMEVFYDVGIGYFFRIDGVPKWNFATSGALGDFSLFYLKGYNDHLLIDYLRLADRYEYPPT